MTSNDPPEHADRVYRSGPAFAAGVLMLGLVGLLCGDALLRGAGRAPVVALAVLFFAVPLITAFTLRPAVFASDARLRVRNPFRTVVVPWAAVEALRATYSCEVVAEGRTYQMWAIPVSLRDRRRAAAEHPPTADAAVAELRELAARHATKPTAQGHVTTHWSYAILTPTTLGTAALLALWLTT